MLFDSRQQAGQLLGEELLKKGVLADVVVGLARGGVVVAAEVARALKKPLDVIIVRKIGAPGSPEFAVGAMAEDAAWWDEETAKRLGLSDEWRREQVEIKKKEVEEYRKQLFPPGFSETATVSRVGRSTLHIDSTEAPSGLNETPSSSYSDQNDVFGNGVPVPSKQDHLASERKKFILVDDGAATGTSMMAAIKGLRAKGKGIREEGKQQRIIVALPVASTDAAEKFRKLADEVVLLEEESFLSSVGQYYRDFSQVEWEAVRRLLQSSREDHASDH